MLEVIWDKRVPTHDARELCDLYDTDPSQSRTNDIWGKTED